MIERNKMVPIDRNVKPLKKKVPETIEFQNLQVEIIRDMSGPIPCDFCDHYIKGAVCEAFPDGIPGEIIAGIKKHLMKWPGQKNNIIFSSLSK